MLSKLVTATALLGSLIVNAQFVGENVLPTFDTCPPLTGSQRVQTITCGGGGGSPDPWEITVTASTDNLACLFRPRVVTTGQFGAFELVAQPATPFITGTCALTALTGLTNVARAGEVVVYNTTATPETLNADGSVNTPDTRAVANEVFALNNQFLQNGARVTLPQTASDTVRYAVSVSSQCGGAFACGVNIDVAVQITSVPTSTSAMSTTSSSSTSVAPTTTPTVAPSQRSTRRRQLLEMEAARLLLQEHAQCPVGTKQCRIPGSNTDAFECIEVDHELNSCGGCITDGTGIDCESLPNVAPNGAGCASGLCFIASCLPGYSTNGTHCEVV